MTQLSKTTCCNMLVSLILFGFSSTSSEFDSYNVIDRIPLCCFFVQFYISLIMFKKTFSLFSSMPCPVFLRLFLFIKKLLRTGQGILSTLNSQLDVLAWLVSFNLQGFISGGCRGRRRTVYIMLNFYGYMSLPITCLRTSG